mgnify:CR=1 FL=1
MFGIRKTVKSVVKSALGLNEPPKQTQHWEAPDLSQVTTTPPPPQTPTPLSEDNQAEPEALDLEEPLEDVSLSEESVNTLSAEPLEEGMELTVENVEEIIDEYIRPGVAADGGDIQLIKIEDNDVYVRLTGACQSCSSAIMTMKMGVEALLREEFPAMRELIDETEYAA